MEYSISEQLRKLVELQKIDSRIFDHKRELEEKPELLNQLKDEFEKKKKHLKELEEQYKALLLERKGKEGDLKVKEDAFAKANTQLSQIKTNKEYTAKLTEIESIKADKSIVEEKILLLYDKTDEVNAALEKEKGVVAAQEKKFIEEKGRIEKDVKVLEENIKSLDLERQKIVPTIDKATLGRYERILHNKEGLAIVPVNGNACGGCYMNVPAQVVNEIKMSKDFIYCEMCARILYLEEDLQPKNLSES